MNLSVLLGFVLGALSAAATVFHTKLGQSFILECGVTSYKQTLKWSQGNEMIIKIDGRSGFRHKGPAEIRLRSNMKRDKNLEISNVRKEDAGTYTCEADSEPHVHTLLVVSVLASPSEEVPLGGEVTLQCEVEGLDPGSAVQWMDPDGRLQTGSNHTHRIQPVTPSHAGTWHCEFSFKGVTLREDLVIRVKDPVPTSPSNSKANAGTPCPNCDMSSPSGGVVQISWWLWAVAGAGCVVVVLLVVLIIILCRRIRRRKKRFQRMQIERRSMRPAKYCQCNRPAAAAKPQRARQKGRPSTLALKPLLME